MGIKQIIKSPFLKILIVFIFIAIGFYFFNLKGGEDQEFVQAQRKDIVQIITATGQVVPLKDLNLQFETQGRVSEIKVNTGQEVSIGDKLIILENDDLELNVLSAQASKKIAQANLDKILAGSPEEEIAVYESNVAKSRTEVNTYEKSVENKEINLENVRNDAEEDLKNSYQDALNTLSDNNITIFNTLSSADEIERSYFLSSTQDALNIKDSVDNIEDFFDESKDYLDIAKGDEEYSDIDSALEKNKEILNSISEELEIIREIMEKAQYRYTITSADKTSIDNERTYINTALTDIIDAQQDIQSTINTNQSNIDSAQASLDSAESSLATAQAGLDYNQKKLEQISAEPKDYDIQLYEGKLEQAEVALVQAKRDFNKTILDSPCNGVVSSLDFEEGEMIKTTDRAISLICKNSYQIEAEIPESDISKIEIGDKANISLDAFPNQDFTGKVNEIEPAETILQGVVYYKIKVIFNNLDSSIKPGMTTDIEIITQEKNNVLTIPQRLIIRRNDNKVVRVLEGEEIIEKIIETGITNNQGEIEIISGLNESDKIVR